MDLRLRRGRYSKGEWVYTCPWCGREGEEEWMNDHLYTAHQVLKAKARREGMRFLPRHREHVAIRSA